MKKCFPRSGPRVFLLGPAGSFSDLAAEKFLRGFRREYCRDLKGVFRKVLAGSFGFVPVFNALAGSIPDTGCLRKSGNFAVLKKLRMPVRMALVARKPAVLENIRYVFAPSVVRKQCKKFLRFHLSHVSMRKALSTSAAIKKIVQLKGCLAYKTAAIGSEKAAKMYGLKILARNIQDDPHNWTEFVLFRGKP